MRPPTFIAETEARISRGWGGGTPLSSEVLRHLLGMARWKRMKLRLELQTANFPENAARSSLRPTRAGGG